MSDAGEELTGTTLKYDRHTLKRRYKTYVRKIQRIIEDIDILIELLLETGDVERAKEFSVLHHTLSIANDLLMKLIDDL